MTPSLAPAGITTARAGPAAKMRELMREREDFILNEVERICDDFSVQLSQSLNELKCRKNWRWSQEERNGHLLMPRYMKLQLD
jgi:hypothetical protein